MSDIIDGGITPWILVGDVDYHFYTSISLSAPNTCYLEAEQVEELIEVLQDRLKEMKG